MMYKNGEIDYGDYCRLVESALAIQRRYQFFLWSRGELQVFLPHATVLCATGDLTRENYRIERFSEYPDADGGKAGLDNLLARLVTAWRLDGHAPLVLEAPHGADGSSGALAAELCRSGLSGCSAHGLLDHEHGIGAFFVFLGGLCEAPPLRAHRLELLVPHLCAALQRIAHTERLASLSLAEAHLLSTREAEIMHWIRAGKTNQEIGQILDISPYTVKNHVQKILRKLNVTNRVQAAGKHHSAPTASAAIRPAVRLARDR